MRWWSWKWCKRLNYICIQVHSFSACFICTLCHLDHVSFSSDCAVRWKGLCIRWVIYSLWFSYICQNHPKKRRISPYRNNYADILCMFPSFSQINAKEDCLSVLLFCKIDTFKSDIQYQRSAGDSRARGHVSSCDFRSYTSKKNKQFSVQKSFILEATVSLHLFLRCTCCESRLLKNIILALLESNTKKRKSKSEPQKGLYVQNW